MTLAREEKECELSICLPIYNRLDCFKYTFDKLIEQLKEIDSETVEVVVSVNPCEDTLEETRNYLHKKQKEYDFLININETNVGISANIDNAIHLIHGRMIWIIGDDDQILNGCVSRVIKILKDYPDVNWIYLAYARLNGFPNDENAVIIEVNNYQLTHGYHKNGKEAVIDAHKKIGGHMLFSSSNIFLKSEYEKIAEAAKDVGLQLGPTFSSSSQGAVYLDNQVGVLAGGCVTWNSIADHSITIRYFQDMCSAIGHGFTQEEIKDLISYHMWHDALHTWFRIYKLCLKGNAYGKESFQFFYHLIPVQTIVTIFLSPVIALHLCLRHQLRNIRRKKSCREYINSENPDETVVSKIRI